MTTDSARSRCLYYRNTFHLPATINPATGGINVRVGLIWAIEMPSYIGQLAKGDLDRRRQGGGPIVCHPCRAVWTFLTRSDVPAAVAAQEARSGTVSGLRSLSPAGKVPLPSPQGRGVFYRRWITLTPGPYRPSGLAVLTSVRTVLSAVNQNSITTCIPRIPARA
ncbi:DNA-directed RNA polymerase subunit beta [Nocardia sp. NPDC057227]|uniref:DNA-directed RNA polymerase subunit beta n=1 Tax=Nocardia sp. NPDC057227 TaxID=3346056 RepID=UPI003636EE09